MEQTRNEDDARRQPEICTTKDVAYVWWSANVPKFSVYLIFWGSDWTVQSPLKALYSGRWKYGPLCNDEQTTTFVQVNNRRTLFRRKSQKHRYRTRRRSNQITQWDTFWTFVQESSNYTNHIHLPSQNVEIRHEKLRGSETTRISGSRGKLNMHFKKKCQSVSILTKLSGRKIAQRNRCTTPKASRVVYSLSPLHRSVMITMEVKWHMIRIIYFSVLCY